MKPEKYILQGGADKMLLSSNVIKQVSCELDHYSIHPKTELKVHKQEKPKPVCIDLDSIKKEADVILMNAQTEAENLLQQAHDQIAAIEEEAYQQGFQKGRQDAQKAAEKTQAELCKTTSIILGEIKEIRESVYRDTEEDLVELAVNIAEKLVCRQLDIKPETIVDIAKAACHQARRCREVILYVAAEQLEDIKASQDEIAAQLYAARHFAIIADPNIKPGGCRIETEQGCIDASLETMLEQLEHIVKGDCP